MRTLIATTLTAAACTLSSLAVPAAHAAHAERTPCAPAPWTSMRKLKPHVELRKNGMDDSVYNNTRDPVTRQVALGYSHTYQVQKSWEVGASAGISWSIVSASVSGKYGHSYTTSDTVNGSKTTTMTIRSHWTGWMRLIVYRHPIVWERLRDHWNGHRCVTHTIAKAVWAPPKHQLVPITKKGHHYPS
jgi:hypothetical protein